MGKNKLKKFTEMESFPNVFQCGARELLPSSHVHPMSGQWREQFFHNDHPIVLELGCGRGEYTVGLAKRYPGKNFIGVDIKGARMWAGAKQAIEEGIGNAAFLRTNIEIITSFFSSDEVDEIWITFCDPQMKKATKRLTSTYFMERYSRIVKRGGIIHLKTDSPFLYRYTSEMLRLNPYPVLCSTDDLYSVSNAGVSQYADARALQTHYEKQWLDRGMQIKYIEWQIEPFTHLEEPTIEIERDTYRSYGRHYAPQNEAKQRKE